MKINTDDLWLRSSRVFGSNPRISKAAEHFLYDLVYNSTVHLRNSLGPPRKMYSISRQHQHGRLKNIRLSGNELGHNTNTLSRGEIPTRRRSGSFYAQTFQCLEFGNEPRQNSLLSSTIHFPRRRTSYRHSPYGNSAHDLVYYFSTSLLLWRYRSFPNGIGTCVSVFLVLDSHCRRTRCKNPSGDHRERKSGVWNYASMEKSGKSAVIVYRHRCMFRNDGRKVAEHDLS